ncbi:spore coat protein [Fictibacillus iocasae]|uniref:Spore coat protein n=1 Tax=Fictibacillus iocasae TaxID=2715437 RepID=A0ABW2NLX2_9BACL
MENQNQNPMNGTGLNPIQPQNPAFLHENMHTGQVGPRHNHGGHEMFDVSEILSGAIGTLNLFTLCKQHIKDAELKQIVEKQYQFICQEYNACLQAFQTGQDPEMRTQSYNMTQENNWTYGMKSGGQPQKPAASVNELNDQALSALMLGTVKSNASLRGMATTEVSNPVLRRVLADSVPNWIEMAYELSIWQNKNHYYQVPQLAEQDMDQIMNGFATAQNNQPPLQ